MKKSEIYHLAQIAVVMTSCIAPEKKIEILHTLMMDEDLQKFAEDQEEKKALTASPGDENTAVVE